MKKRHWVTYDSESSGGGNPIVHAPRTPIQFQQSPSGLYFHDMPNSNIVAFTKYNVATMQDNSICYTPR